MSKGMNKKKKVAIGVGFLVGVSAGAGTFYVTQNEDKTETPTLEDQIEKSMVDKMFAYTENGEVRLYDSKNGKELDSFDLKTLSTGKEVVVESKPVQTPHKPAEKKAEVKEEFEGFLRVPHIVVKGENSWKIQEALTPKRDTATMLKMVAKANGKTKLHPIFPGQTLYYLKEKDGSSPDEVVKEVETGKKFEKEVVQKTVKKVDENAVYLYDKSDELTVLYAYNDIEKTFYSVTEEEGKVKGEILFALPDVEGVNEFKVVDGKAYILHAGKTKMTEISLDNPAKKKEQTLQGEVDLFTVRDGIIYYTFADQLGKLNMSDGEHEQLLLGDKSTDYVFTTDHLFILNTFGSKLDNSVLMKINPLEMNVEDLVELKSNENAILSEQEDTENVLVGQVVKIKELDKEVRKEQVVLPVNTKNLQKELFIKDVPFNQEAFEVDGFIFEVAKGVTTIYSATNGQKAVEIDVKEATSVMPVK